MDPFQGKYPGEGSYREYGEVRAGSRCTEDHMTLSGTEFCDWYIEIVKPRLFAKEEDPASANAAFWTLRTVLIDSLKLLHPYMPFITEEIFCTIQSEEESIMISSWPEYKEQWNNPAAEEMAEEYQERYPRYP